MMCVARMVALTSFDNNVRGQGPGDVYGVTFGLPASPLSWRRESIISSINIPYRILTPALRSEAAGSTTTTIYIAVDAAPAATCCPFSVIFQTSECINGSCSDVCGCFSTVAQPMFYQTAHSGGTQICILEICFVCCFFVYHFS